MKLLAFRIKNFRSIVDTKWCPFSRDHVTVLVGQNESGKTSILDALHCLLGNGFVSSDDLRAATPMPEMSAKCEVSVDEFIAAAEEHIEELAGNWSPSQHAVISKFIESQKGILELTMNWSANPETPGKFDWVMRINGGLEEMLENAKIKAEALENTIIFSKNIIAAATKIDPPSDPNEKSNHPFFFSAGQIAEALHLALPTSTLFNPESGLLPNTVDIDEKFNLTGNNKAAASNYLRIANLELKNLLKIDRRERQFLLSKAKEKISKDFNLFWTQTIGRNRKLEIGCEIENYGADAGDKAGKPHLVFGISDGHSMLYPKQRSEGVRWFVSFYLQLKASQARGLRRIFLMDEPGANLHPKAQEDVLRLVNSLSDKIDIVYSTHSSALLEFSKLYRVHAVQRVGEDDDSPTEIIDAHSLSAASTDTLTPLLMAMGTDLSSQNVIKRKITFYWKKLSDSII
jgi:predicted ATP-dependent endonuclease of OLD family